MSNHGTGIARAAVFLDRDGTIIDDVHYVADPDLVRLRPGAAEAIAKLNHAAIPVIVVTNQSGIARGLFTEADYQRVQARLAELLAAQGAHVDASYMCPHHPDFRSECECRKPGTLLFRRAAQEHGLDLTRSVYIGDRWRDVAPALALGGRAILVADVTTPADELTRAERLHIPVLDSLEEAVTRALSSRALG